LGAGLLSDEIIRRRTWRRLTFVACFICAVIASGTPAHAQEPSFLPDSLWGLVLPPGFEPRDAPIPHFAHPDRAHIVIQEIFQPLDEGGLGPVGAVVGEGAQALRIEAFEETEIGGRRGLLWSARNVASSALTLMLFVEGDQSVASITAVIGAGSAVEPDRLRAALATVTLREIDITERLATFPIDIQDLAGFKVAQFRSDALLLTEDGSYTDASSYPASFITVIAHRKLAGERMQDMLTEIRLAKREMVQTQFPAGKQLSSDIIRTWHGQAVTTQFEFTQPGGAVFDGDTVMMITRCCSAIAVADYRSGTEGSRERFSSFWQSIRDRR
jgi:hypothetical protein